MQTLLDKITANLQKTGLDLRTRESRNWLTNKVKDLKKYDPKNILKDQSRTASRIVPGKMYFYNYDPKGKDTLSYYDQFPLVFPIEMYNDGWLGMNLHYIRPRQRLVLLDKLYSTLNNDKFDETSKIRVSYSLLSGAAQYKEFAPCLKRYLASHVRSRLIEISPNEWEVAAVLPVDMFHNANRNKVYKDSKEIIDAV